jgi:hypothetical protein
MALPLQENVDMDSETVVDTASDIYWPPHNPPCPPLSPPRTMLPEPVVEDVKLENFYKYVGLFPSARTFHRTTSSSMRPRFIHFVMGGKRTCWVNIRDIEHAFGRDYSMIFPKFFAEYLSPKADKNNVRLIQMNHAKSPLLRSNEMVKDLIFLGSLVKRELLLDEEYPPTSVTLTVSLVLHFEEFGSCENFMNECRILFEAWMFHWKMEKEMSMKRGREEVEKEEKLEADRRRLRSIKVKRNLTKEFDEIAKKEEEEGKKIVQEIFNEHLHLCWDQPQVRMKLVEIFGEFEVEKGFETAKEMYEREKKEKIEKELKSDMFEGMRKACHRLVDNKEEEEDEEVYCLPLAQEVPMSPVLIEDDGNLSEEF